MANYYSFDKLKRSVDFVRVEKARAENVLVAYGAGMSRAASFVRSVKGRRTAESTRCISASSSQASQARPHLALWQSLCEDYDEDVPDKDIFQLIRRQHPGYSLLSMIF